MKILIVEDEKELNKSILLFLKTEGYVCEQAFDVESTIRKIEVFDYDCILLDISLPDGNGFKILQELKANNKADGVIIISAKNSVEDRIAGLNLGADDYLPKPFHLTELSARISAIIRRRRFDGKSELLLNEISIDTFAKTVQIHGTSIDLTKKEYDLLLYLASNKNRIISKNAIADHLSENDTDNFDSFDFIYAHIKNLKKKMMNHGCNDYIKSIYGMGYKFEI